MDILSYKSGQVRQYVERQRGIVLEKMSSVMDAQAAILMDQGYDALCGASPEEFGRRIMDLKEAVADCKLCAEPRVHSAVIMIPSRIASPKQMRIFGISGTLDDKDLEDEVKLLEPYVAVNVTLKQMDKSQILTGINNRFAGIFPRLATMSISEAIMLATYYPSLFDEAATVITDPKSETVMVLEGYRKENGGRVFFKLTVGSRRDLTWISQLECKKYQIPICEIRIKR